MVTSVFLKVLKTQAASAKWKLFYKSVLHSKRIHVSSAAHTLEMQSYGLVQKDTGL